MKVSKDKKSVLTKQIIIEKSAILFNRNGFAGTSMKEIMDATGLSKGAIYGHFKSKEEIALASFDQAVIQVWSEIKERTNVIDNPLDKLKAVVYFYKERILNPPVEGGCPIQNTAVDTDDGNPLLRERVKHTIDLWRKNICKMLHLGMKDGYVRVDVTAADFAIRFVAILEGGIMLSNLYKDLHYFDVVAQQLIKMIEELRA